MIAKREAWQEDTVEQALELGRLAAPPHRKSDDEMIAGGDGRANAFKVRLPWLHDPVALSKDRIEGEIAHRDAFDLRVIAEGSLVEVEQMADQPAFVGMTIEDENAHHKLFSEVDLGP